MPRRAKPFTLYKRKYLVKGKPIFVWCYQVRDPETGKYRGFSTGLTAKSDAENFVLDLYRTGSLIPKNLRGPASCPTIEEYSKDFWKFDSHRVRLALKRKRLSPAYCESMHRTLELHWWPAFGTLRLDQLTLKNIDDLVLVKLEGNSKIGIRPLSSKMVSQIIAAMRAVYDHAIDHEVISKNPFAKLKPIQILKEARGVLDPMQARFLLSDPSHFDSPILWALNLTACATGCRAGELLGLRVQSVHSTWIQVESVKRAKVGVVPDTKTGEKGKRSVPIPPVVSNTLRSLCLGKDPNDLVFGDLPFYLTSQSLSRALERAGIMSKAERIERKIDFHSWRHLYATMLRGRVSDTDLRATTGHETMAMLESYSDHVLPERLEAIARAQEQAFDGFGVPNGKT